MEANNTGLKFGGLTREEVIGPPLWEIPWWGSTPETHKRLREAVVEAAQGRSMSFEVEVRSGNGVLVSHDFSLRPVRDEKGSVVLLVLEGPISPSGSSPRRSRPDSSPSWTRRPTSWASRTRTGGPFM